jgi:hypothetical protein
MMANAPFESATPLTLSLSQQSRLGEIAIQLGQIRKRIWREKERQNSRCGQFEGPFSQGEKGRMRGVALRIEAPPQAHP